MNTCTNLARLPLSRAAALVVAGMTLVAFARESNAQEQPFKGSLPIRVTVVETWPGAPELPASDVKSDHPVEGTAVLTAGAFAKLLQHAQAANAVVSRPRMEVLPGLRASLSVGKQGASGAQAEGFSFSSLVSLVELPNGLEGDHLYTMQFECDRAGGGVSTVTRANGVRIPQGTTAVMLAKGGPNAKPWLVCVTPGNDKFTVNFDPSASVAPVNPTAQTPLINFISSIYRVDAPKDYGSPKGDGPRKNWAAYPGGATLSADEFKTFMSDLRAKPGCVLLTQPSVWVNPKQRATIEVAPEPDSTEARHTIQVAGTHDASGKAVQSTGSYSRRAGGMTTEGAWNKPRACPEGGAIVWSIHDPERGAWYTLVVQPVLYTQENMPAPQVSSAPAGATIPNN